LFLFSGTEPTLHDHGVSYIQNNIHSAIEVWKIILLFIYVRELLTI
jgi:hypothetical protein